MGFGFESEQSPRVSVLFRVDWHWMQGEVDPPPYSSYTTQSTYEVSTINWSLGARAYIAKLGPARSYVDGGFGVRLVNDGYGRIILLPATAGGANSTAKDEGLAMVVRLGLTSAPPGRPGFFLDSGIDLLVDNPDRNGLITARLGVLFP